MMANKGAFLNLVTEGCGDNAALCAMFRHSLMGVTAQVLGGKQARRFALFGLGGARLLELIAQRAGACHGVDHRMIGVG